MQWGDFEIAFAGRREEVMCRHREEGELKKVITVQRAGFKIRLGLDYAVY